MRFYGFGRLPIDHLDFDKVAMAELLTSVDRTKRYLYPKPILSERRVVAGHRALAQQIIKLPPGTAISALSITTDTQDELAMLEAERLGDEEGKSRAHCARLLIDHTLSRVKEMRPELREEGQGGRTPSARGIAREWVADMLGIRPQSVAQYDKTRPTAKKKPAPGFVLKDWGLPYPKELRDQAAALHRSVSKAIAHQRIVCRDLSGTPLHQRAVEWLEALKDDLPEAICPYCKAWGWLKDQCPHCGGTGIAGHRTLAMSAVFVRLWKEDEYWGRDKDDKWVSLDEVRQEA